MDRDERLDVGSAGGPAGEAAVSETSAAGSIESLERVRSATRSRVRTGALPVLIAAALVVAVGVGAVWSGLLRGPAGGSGGSGGGDGFQLSGRIGCFGQGPGFSPDLLVSGTPTAETAAGAPASALRAFLAQNLDMPASGWTMISGSGSTVTYLAPVPNAPSNDYVEVTFEPGTPGNGSYGADGWRTAGYGSCQLMSVPPSGYGPATWALDPATPYSAGSTRLHVLVEEWGCHSFATAAGRIIQNVQYDADAVVVTLAVLARQGPQLCPGTPPTPYVVLLTQPVGTRTLTDGTPWPPALIAMAGSPFYTPSPTPEPANWHMPMDCTGEADGPGSFKAASMMAKFEVYCASLPAGWQRAAMSDFAQVVTSVSVTYRGPNGETFELTEGDFCTGSASVCAPGGTDLGTATFGDMQGRLVGEPPNADFALYVAAGQSPSWKATGSGMSLDAFKALTAALIVVAK